MEVWAAYFERTKAYVEVIVITHHVPETDSAMAMNYAVMVNLFGPVPEEVRDKWEDHWMMWATHPIACDWAKDVATSIGQAMGGPLMGGPLGQKIRKEYYGR